ncbi:MAG: nucleoside-diphosphate kinase [Acidobacteria bacterium]|uniref:Nucleoside diphosphate kinase n=1 Tax=Paludibaculum fermentans TaxID=1473598 RepID=A0A7S7SKA3_PALFE|nr:nucleoside-diphosphate kinase [Paludibaculum fermentans]MBN9663420.1 nucleoside-diphosphate kinase [Acidobacteriota bacterium]QOY88942.1 nucleoside-diphosphate kinase [Paludibaculum fermentans]
MERTFAIIKPDAVADGNAGNILALIEKNGFKVLALRKQHLTRPIAEGFYAVHKGKGFFEELIAFMTEGPVILLALEREDAVAKWREVMGATNPEKAEAGTVRKLYGANIGRNASHGSDSQENAAIELAWFFRGYELN